MVNSLFVSHAASSSCFLSSSAYRAVLTAWAEAPNIIFITVDTTRADRMGFLGNKHGLTPNLDAVAQPGCRI